MPDIVLPLNACPFLPVSFPFFNLFFLVKGLFFGSANWEVHFVIRLNGGRRGRGVSLSVLFELMVKFLPFLIKKTSESDTVEEKHKPQKTMVLCNNEPDRRVHLSGSTCLRLSSKWSLLTVTHYVCSMIQ